MGLKNVDITKAYRRNNLKYGAIVTFVLICLGIFMKGSVEMANFDIFFLEFQSLFDEAV